MQNNLGLFITKRATISPNTEAIVDVASGRRLSYAELNARCNRLANGLVTGGLTSGDRRLSFMTGPVLDELLRQGEAEWSGLGSRRPLLEEVRIALRDGVGSVTL